jgi:hypothetical protein
MRSNKELKLTKPSQNGASQLNSVLGGPPGGSRLTRKAKVVRREGESAFLNVDVDVRSRKPLDPLVAALDGKCSVHYLGRHSRRYWAHFAPYSPKSAEEAIKFLSRTLGALPTTARRLWSNADERVFDVGIQAGLRPHPSEFLLSEAAVASIVRLGGSVRVTVYAARRPSTASSRGGRGRPTKS